MNRWIELLVGLIFVIGGILIAWTSSAYSWVWLGKDFNFLHPAWILLKGGLFWVVILVGTLLIVLGINDLKE
jgi:hypothetical protein|tara:strand:- start:9152 stop:9367 length:216 start_codon:yes stop_codon:yes gene_type:complete